MSTNRADRISDNFNPDIAQQKLVKDVGQKIETTTLQGTHQYPGRVQIVPFGASEAQPLKWNLPQDIVFTNEKMVPGAIGPFEIQDDRPPLTKFEQELRRLINAHSLENLSGTPDMILAEYLSHCLQTFNIAMQQRERWYGRKIFGGTD
jgi:hypothetical protein